MRALIGPYRRITDDPSFPIPRWDLPEGAATGVDFRAIPAMSDSPVGDNIGVFTGVEAEADRAYDVIDDTESLTARDLAKLGAALDLHGGLVFSGSTLGDFIEFALTRHGDPSGRAKFRPGVLRNGTLTTKQLDVLEFDYDVLRRQWQDEGEPESRRYLKWLHAKGQQHRLSDSDIERVQGQNPKENPRRPETTHTENFNGSDKDGVGYEHTWTATAGANGWKNHSNAARKENGVVTTNDYQARCDSSVSTDDHRVGATVIDANNSQACVTARSSASVMNTYYGFGWFSTSGGRYYLWKFVAGTFTSIAFKSASQFSGSDLVELEVTNSDIEGFKNSSSELTGTDSTITANLRGGLYGYQVSGTLLKWDNFSITDAETSGTIVPLLEGGMMNGGLQPLGGGLL